MFKVLKKYLPALIIFLLGGYIGMHDYSHQGSLKSAEAGFQIKSAGAIFSGVHTPKNEYNAIGQGSKRRERSYTEEDEKEGYDSLVPRTYGDVSTSFASFCFKSSNYFFPELKIHSLLSAHWFYASSFRYIILRVIRI